MSWLSQFLHPGQAYDKAKVPLEQGYNEGKDIRQPFINQGQGAGDQLQKMMDMLSNPGKLQNEWSQGYTESPYAKQLEEQNTQQGLDSASGMGLLGSSGAQANIQKGAGNIVQEDRQNYMKDLMDKFMQSIGIGENLHGTGANTANQGATAAQQHGESQAGLTFGKNQAGANQLGEIGGGALRGLLAYLTGGTSEVGRAAAAGLK